MSQPLPPPNVIVTETDANQVHDAVVIIDGDSVADRAQDKPEPEVELEFEPPTEWRCVPRITTSQIDEMAKNLGVIDTSFPAASADIVFEAFTAFPVTYTTVSAKEKLLLYFAENFRRQLNIRFKDRAPIPLALANECNVQKFVSTTIRPAALLFPELINSWQNCASLIADFVLYEPPDHPTAIPHRLLSPDTVLRRRRGNAFEMATLLCSVLAGAGYAAFVVCGYATRAATLNDQRHVECPLNVPAATEDEPTNVAATQDTNSKYTLREAPDLRSQFLLERDRREAERQKRDVAAAQALIDRQRELTEKPATDSHEGRRVHAWVAIINNAPLCCRATATGKPVRDERAPSPSDDNGAANVGVEDEDDDDDEATTTTTTTKGTVTAFFVEPTTGCAHAVTTPLYTGIESMWNQHNYYVNIQTPITNVAGMRWNVGATADWEHFLLAEPPEMRVARPAADGDVEPEAVAPVDETLANEKHLDMPVSWVRELEISYADYEQRFVNGEKVIAYKKCIFERFAPYKKKDGLAKRLTVYEDIDCMRPLTRWEWYENRADLMVLIKVDCVAQRTHETFAKGRSDCLKFFAHTAGATATRQFDFYHKPRLDCLRRIEMDGHSVREHFAERDDRLIFREFHFLAGEFDGPPTSGRPKLRAITEKFSRNPAMPAHTDVAERCFAFGENKIRLQFHYDKFAITASRREFIKPAKPDYGEEIRFDATQTSAYVANPLEPTPTQAELYRMLLHQLAGEEQALRTFDRTHAHVTGLLYDRKRQLANPVLRFSIFDPLRNEAAKRNRMLKHAAEKARQNMAAKAMPDYLAPYLAQCKGKRPSYEESVRVYNACLDDLQRHHVAALNDLQRRLHELAAEAHALKRFVHKFHDQFDDAAYDLLAAEGDNLERQQRVVRQRIADERTRGEQGCTQLRHSLKHDARLNLN